MDNLLRLPLARVGNSTGPARTGLGAPRVLAACSRDQAVRKGQEACSRDQAARRVHGLMGQADHKSQVASSIVPARMAGRALPAIMAGQSRGTGIGMMAAGMIAAPGRHAGMASIGPGRAMMASGGQASIQAEMASTVPMAAGDKSMPWLPIRKGLKLGSVPCFRSWRPWPPASCHNSAISAPLCGRRHVFSCPSPW